MRTSEAETRPGLVVSRFDAAVALGTGLLQVGGTVLGVLRRVDEDVPRAPTPGMGRLEELVAGAVAAGLAVDVVVDGRRRPLPPTVDVAAYRIVQEALTNVTRHAGAAAATVRLAYGDGDVIVQVDDDGRGTRSPSPPNGPGNGIAGMKKRAAVLGGTLQAGPGPEGGYRVRAWLPAAEPAAEPAGGDG